MSRNELILRLGILSMFCGLFIVACVPTPPGPPPGWSIVDTIVNSATPGIQPGNARQTVFFSQIPWQSTRPNDPYFAEGWRNDVLVGSSYSFQLRLDGGNFGNGGLILRDPATGLEVPATAARVNHSENCGPNGHRPLGGTNQTADSSKQCYYNPGETPSDPTAVGFITRPVLPQNSDTYSVELVPSCQGQLQYLSMTCPTQPDVATVLTISPRLRPSPPVHGQAFRWDIVSKNANGETSTRLTAVYVQPNHCTIDNFFISPSMGDAGTRVMTEWFVRDCHTMQVRTDDTAVHTLAYASTTAPEKPSEANFNDTRPYMLPKRLKTVMTLEARDALGKLTQRSASVSVSPCSISSTHAQCPTRCQASRPPPGCPQPLQPVCPSGQGDANRQPKQFNFEVLCNTGGGTAFKRPESEWACTEAEARQSISNRQVTGCAIVQATGTWVSPGDGTMTPGTTCMGGAMPTAWKFCLACSSQTGVIRTSEARDACFLNDAVDLAKTNRPTQNCWLNNQGACP